MIFEYTDMNKRPAHCDIEKIGNVVIMTELANNTGASVTNSCEYIAKQYTAQNDLSVNDLIFVERYDYRSYETRKPHVKNAELPNYTLVTFTDSETMRGKLTPNWKHLSMDDFNALIKSKNA